MVRYIVTCVREQEQTRFGLAVIEGDKTVDWIEDVLPGLERTAALADRLQQNGVPAEHFRDVIGDMVANAYSL